MEENKKIQPLYQTKSAVTSVPIIGGLLLVFPFLLGVVPIGFAIYNVLMLNEVSFFELVNFLSGLFLLLFGLFSASMGCATYRFEEDGIYAKYPLQAPQVIPWDAFQQVCVCYGGYTTRGERKASTYICCVKKGEKPNVYGRWKTDNVFRHRRVITITYTPELHEGIKERCPYEVVDLRNTLNYRLDMS